MPRKSDIFETNSRSVPVEYLVDRVHPDLLTDRSRLFKYRGFEEKYKRKKGNVEESGIVHSSIHSSKIVHYFIHLFLLLLLFHSRRTFDIDPVKEQVHDSLIENDGRSLRNEDPSVPYAGQPVSEAVRLSEIPSERRPVGYFRRPIT